MGQLSLWCVGNLDFKISAGIFRRCYLGRAVQDLGLVPEGEPVVIVGDGRSSGNPLEASCRYSQVG